MSENLKSKEPLPQINETCETVWFVTITRGKNVKRLGPFLSAEACQNTAQLIANLYAELEAS